MACFDPVPHCATARGPGQRCRFAPAMPLVSVMPRRVAETTRLPIDYRRGSTTAMSRGDVKQQSFRWGTNAATVALIAPILLATCYRRGFTKRLILSGV